MSRDDLILQYMPIVDSIVGKFQRGHLPPHVEADDLRSEGILALIAEIDRPTGRIQPNKQIARRVKDACLDWIRRECAAVGVSFSEARLLDEKTGEWFI